MQVLHRLRRTIAAAQPAPAGERRDRPAPSGQAAGGQAPSGPPSGQAAGGRETMSARDADIVLRIRWLCPDGGSDAELLQLFKHNRRALGRSDEDVIAAMIARAGAYTLTSGE